MFYPLFWREFLEPLFPGEQLIAIFQSGERRRALPLVGWQGVERLVELPPGVGHADVLWQLMVALIAVRVKIPGKAVQELLRVFRLLAGLVLVEHDGRSIVLARSVQPHIALGLGLLPRLVEHLEVVSSA